MWIDFDKLLTDNHLNQSQLSDLTGIDQSTISRMIKGLSKSMSSDNLKRLENYFGEENIKKYAHKSRPKEINMNIKDTRVAKINPTGALTYSKPYYAVDVFGTPGAEIIDQDEQYAEPMFYISIPELKDVDIYIRVTGDSMYPKYRHGDIIGIKKLNAREFFAWYEPYVVVTRGNYQRILKYIHPHPDDPEKLLLVSFDSNKYPPQPIDTDSIHEIWQVLGKIEL